MSDASAVGRSGIPVGDVLGLEVYGVDFVGQGQAMTVVDINPFPSFRELPQAPLALWRHLESSLSA